MSGLSKRQLALRSDAIGASEIAALAGLSRWAAPIEIFEAKKGLVEKEQTLAMDLGIEFEEPIAKVYARQTGKWLRRVDTLKNPRYPFAIATPDRAVFPARVPDLSAKKLLVLEDLGGIERLLQVKSTSWRLKDEWGEPGTDQVAEYYLAQGQWEMGVAGAQFLDFAVLFDKDRFEVYRLQFNHELFDGLYEIGQRFMVDHVRANKPPPPDASDAYGEFLGRWFPKETQGLVVEASDELAEQIVQYARLKQGAKRIDDLLKGAGNWIQSQLGEVEGVAHRRFGRLTWKRTRDGSKTNWEAVANDALRIAGLSLMSAVSEEGALELAEELKGLVPKHTTPKPGYRVMRGTWASDADFKTQPLSLSLPAATQTEANEE